MKPKSLQEHRQEIDNIDKQIIPLLIERILIAQKIGTLKQENKETHIYQPQREKKVYENIEKLTASILQGKTSRKPIHKDILLPIMKEILAVSRSAQEQFKIHYLGPPASFSYLALQKFFGSATHKIEETSVQNVFRNLEASNAEEVRFGIVPRDNLIEGPVGATLDAFIKSKLNIYAECYLPIIHNLIGDKQFSKTQLNKIKKLYTIKIAYQQCYDWVHQHFNSNLEIVETTSTAAAAQMASNNGDGVAIASKEAAKLYSLELIRENIQNNANNLTRFFILSHKEAMKAENNKTSIVFTLLDRPGALSKILLLFQKTKINLTCIESRTSRRSFGEYNFFIDFDGHKNDAQVKKILHLISKNVSFMKILGSYPKGTVN